MLRKLCIAVFSFCTLWNVVTALPPRTVVTTKWPSLTSSNPKCPTIPLWKDLKPTLQDLTAKNLLPPDFRLKLLRTLDEQIKNCEDKLVEIEAENIDKKNNDESSTNAETDKKLDTNDEEVVNNDNIDGNNDENIDETEDIEEITEDLDEDPEVNKEDNIDYESEKPNTAKTISPTTTEKPHEFKSLFNNLPSFLPIFKPRAIVTARRMNSSQKFPVEVKENFNNKSQDKQDNPTGNNVIIQLTKTSKFEPAAHTLEAKQVSNGTSTEVKTKMAHDIIASEIPQSKYTKPIASVSSTTIPETNIIHLNSNNQQSLQPNYVFVANPKHVNDAGNNPQNPPSNTLSQTPELVNPFISSGPYQGITIQDDSMKNVPVNQISLNPSIVTQVGSYPGNFIPVNTNCNSVPSNIAQNCPCPISVHTNMPSVANPATINAPLTMPVNSLPQNCRASKSGPLAVPLDSLPQNVIPSNTAPLGIPISAPPQNTSPYASNTVIPTCNSYSRNVPSNQYSCLLPSNHGSPVPLNSLNHIPSMPECNRKCIERSQKPNIVFFKPEDVEILNLQGDLLKKMKMTVLVPTYVTQIDV